MILSAYLGVPGLSDIGYRFYNGDETANGSRITAGVLDASDGWYSADATLPSGVASVRWNSSGQPTIVAREYFSAAAVDSNAIAAAVWQVLVSTFTVPGTAGKLVADNLDIAVSTRATQASVNIIDDFVDTEINAIKVVTDKLETALEADGPVYRYTANALEQAPATGGGGTGDAMQATLLEVKAKTDTLPSDPADASDIAASFSTVNLKLDAIDDFVDTEVSAIKAKTDALPADPASTAAIAAQFSVTNAKIDVVDDYVDTEVGAIKTVTDKLDTALVADGGVWQYTANALELGPAGGGGGSGDASQATLLAVKAKTDALPSDPADASDIAASFATVNSTLGTIAGYVDTEVAAIKAKTDQLVFTSGRVDANAAFTMSAGDLNNIADAILKRDFSLVSGEAARSLINAARFLRNKWSVAGSALTVTKEDDATPAWTSTLVTTPGADPITSSDPA